VGALGHGGGWLADPSGALGRPRDAASTYPPALRERVVRTALTEADFALRSTSS
jgi:hypothetical protein